MRLIDADALKYKNVAEVNGILTHILTAEEIDNAPAVEYPFYQEAYQTGYEEGKNERLKGKCENCDLYFKAMTKEEMRKGGAE